MSKITRSTAVSIGKNEMLLVSDSSDLFDGMLERLSGSRWIIFRHVQFMSQVCKRLKSIVSNDGKLVPSLFLVGGKSVAY